MSLATNSPSPPIISADGLAFIREMEGYRSEGTKSAETADSSGLINELRVTSESAAGGCDSDLNAIQARTSRAASQSLIAMSRPRRVKSGSGRRSNRLSDSFSWADAQSNKRFSANFELATVAINSFGLRTDSGRFSDAYATITEGSCSSISTYSSSSGVACPEGIDLWFVEFASKYGMEGAAVRFLGKGSVKRVSLLTKDETHYALQVLRTNTLKPGVVEGVKRNVELIRGLRLKRSIPILGIDFINHELFIVTKFCNRGSLSDYISERTLQEKVSLLIEAIKAVQELHFRGIYHRDIKAENFLVHQEEEEDKIKVYLSDFDCITGKVRRGSLTHAYLNPPDENCKQAAYDVWMCGLMMIMILGDISDYDLPWVKEKDSVKQNDLKQDLRPLLSRIEVEELSEICRLATHSDPEQRIGTGRIIQRLQDYLLMNSKGLQ